MGIKILLQPRISYRDLPRLFAVNLARGTWSKKPTPGWRADQRR
jgi:hypothetical protein